MSIDFGLVIVIVAVLVFYLRLIILQRQRAKQLRQRLKMNKPKPGKGTQAASDSNGVYTVISRNPLDRLIGVMGLILVIFGLSVYASFFTVPILQPYWWIPTAVGIIAFSWAFKL
jgi:hypothetical protein